MTYATGPQCGGGGGTGVPLLSERPGLCLHPSTILGCGAYYPPYGESAASSSFECRCESLQGRNLSSSPTPRRYHAIPTHRDAVRLHRMSPVFTLLLRAGATLSDRTRVLTVHNRVTTCVVRVLDTRQSRLPRTGSRNQLPPGWSPRGSPQRDRADASLPHHLIRVAGVHGETGDLFRPPVPWGPRPASSAQPGQSP